MNENLQTQKIGRYEIIKELGRGNMGVVYLARDPYIDRNVAVKIALNQDAGSEEKPTRFSREFFQEARSAGQLMHPNIVAVYDANVHSGYCYIAMEYVDGQDMQEFCRRDSLLSVERVVDIVFNSSRGLDYAHNMNIVHRDIKPANIMINSDGVAKIGDFGIACLTEDTPKGACIGTPHYMSPEQIDQKSYDCRSDIFSLGSVLYELLTGEKAFHGEHPAQVINKIMNEEPVPLLEHRPKLPKELGATVRKALSRNPDERYQTCLDFSYDLKFAMQQLNGTKHEHCVDDVLDYICNIPFFKDFSREQVANLIAASNTLKCCMGDVIITEGEIDDTLYIILSGKVSVFKKNRKITDIDKGECFGEMAYISHRPRDATVIASTDCIMLKISSTLMSRQPESVQLLFMKSFAETLAGRLAKDNRIISYFMRRIYPD